MFRDLSPILHFRKQLVAPPVAAEVAGFRLRPVRIPEDVPNWLALRERAMAGERPAVRPWSTADFAAEMTAKPWWRTDRCWLAERDDGAANAATPAVGTVTLALRAGEASAVPIIHWLLVDPAYRRQHVAQLLVTQLELAAWQDGWREVQLETHAGWKSAVAFYQSMGYTALDARSPR